MSNVLSDISQKSWRREQLEKGNRLTTEKIWRSCQETIFEMGESKMRRSILPLEIDTVCLVERWLQVEEEKKYIEQRVQSDNVVRLEHIKKEMVGLHEDPSVFASKKLKFDVCVCRKRLICSKTLVPA